MSNNLLQTSTMPIGTVTDSQTLTELSSSGMQASNSTDNTQMRIDVSEPIQVLVNAANLAQRRGAFNLSEASAISDAINKIADAVKGSN